MPRSQNGHSALVAWLDERGEPAPSSLRQPLADAVRAVAPSFDGTLGDLASTAGEQLLTKLLSDGRGERGSALQLLAADALVTYAFEAAADDDGLSARAIDARAAEAMRRVAKLGESA